MKRRSFIAGLIALPVVAKSALAIPEAEASAAHLVEVQGLCTGAGTIWETWNGYETYSRSYEISTGVGAGSLEAVKRNGRFVYDRSNGVYDAGFMGRAKFYRNDGVLCMSLTDDDVTDMNGAVPLYSFTMLAPA